MAKAKAKPKAKAKSKPKAKAKPIKQEGAIQMITQGNLVTLINRCVVLQKNVSNASGDMGDLIRDYAENKALHRGAFRHIKALFIMGKKDPSKLWLHLAHFDDMRAKLGLDEIAEVQGQLVEAGVEEVVKKPRAASKKKPADVTLTPAPVTVANEEQPTIN